MPKVKVLQVISALGNGGVESMIMNIYRKINHEKITFDFIIHTNERKYFEEIKKFGGNVYQIPNLRDVGIIKYCKNLAEVIENNGPYDIVHSHNLLHNAFI